MPGQKVVNTKKIKWKELRKGAYIKNLAKQKAAGMQYDLLKIDPGMKFPTHRHASFEWVYVLNGIFEDENGKYPKDTFLINYKGSFHTSGSTKGCLLLVYWSGRHEKM